MQYTTKLGLKKPDLTDYVNVNDLNENMDILDQEIANITDEETGVEAKLTQHLDKKDNPHNVTKSQVGLGNLENYGIATQAEAEAGTSTVKYMTPQRTKQLLDVRKGNRFGLDVNQVISSDIKSNLFWSTATYGELSASELVDGYKIRMKKDGTYLITSSINLNQNGTGHRYIELYFDGTANGGGAYVMKSNFAQAVADTNTTVQATTLINAKAGDIIYVATSQNSGQSLNAMAFVSHLDIVRL